MFYASIPWLVMKLCLRMYPRPVSGSMSILSDAKSTLCMGSPVMVLPVPPPPPCTMNCDSTTHTKV